MQSDTPPAFPQLRDIDWDDTGAILRHGAPVLESIAREPGVLAQLLDNLLTDEHLRSMCEGYDFMTKLVLYDDSQAEVRVRLHLYRSGYFDRPHNHRWSFASYILRGSYVHRIFGRDDMFGEDTDVDALWPIHERIEGAGTCYALHHNSVHSVQAAADSISILLRGPAAKDRFLILDRSGDSFWVYGAAQESTQKRESKRLTGPALEAAVAHIRHLTQPLDSTSLSGPT